MWLTKTTNVHYIKFMSEINIPKEPSVRREWIKYQLRLKGYSLRQLSIEQGVYPNVAAVALIRTFPKWERIIANRIGVLPQELWPERYDDKGRPINHSSRYPRNDTTMK